MKHRVFVVDDDPHYAALVRHRLAQHAACEVRTFVRGEAALAHLDAAPDLVLLDAALPGLGGLVTLRRLQAQRPALPVIVMEPPGLPAATAQAMRRAAYDGVVKGRDDAARLEAAVRRALEQVTLTRRVQALRQQIHAAA